MGYRGYFDIDVVVAKTLRKFILLRQILDALEEHTCNDIAKKTFWNKMGEKNFLISNDQFCYGKKVIAPKINFDKIKNLLYPMKNSQSLPEPPNPNTN